MRTGCLYRRLTVKNKPAYERPDKNSRLQRHHAGKNPDKMNKGKLESRNNYGDTQYETKAIASFHMLLASSGNNSRASSIETDIWTAIITE